MTILDPPGASEIPLHLGSRSAILGNEVLFVEDFRHPVTSFWNDGVGGATRDNDVPFGGLPSLRLDTQLQSGTNPTVAAPTLSPLSIGGTGGSLAPATYFYKVAAKNEVGAFAPSAEQSGAVSAGQKVTLAWTRIDGATGYNIYRATSTGAEVLLTTVAGNGTLGFVDDGTLAPVGTATSGATSNSPGRTANTGGVVAKRRITDGLTSWFGMDLWFRMTSINLSSNAFPIIAVYNRDGASAFHGRLWLNPMGNNVPMQGWILDGDATRLANPGNEGLGSKPAVWRSVVTSPLQNGSGQHSYDLSNGGLDRAGGWHHAKLVVDLATKKYVSCELDGQFADLSAYSLDATDSTGAAMMHFSAEFFGTTSARRYINIARVIGTQEA